MAFSLNRIFGVLKILRYCLMFAFNYFYTKLLLPFLLLLLLFLNLSLLLAEPMLWLKFLLVFHKFHATDELA